MAFVQDLGLGLDAPYYDEARRAYVIDFQLGYESAQGGAYSILMSVILWQDDPAQSNAVELCFGIRRESIFPPHELTDLEETDYDSDAARRYVSEVARASVTKLILAAIGSLTVLVEPPAIIMHTFHAHLPPRAMAKYYKVCNELGFLSYELFEYERGTDDGVDHWFFNIRS